MARIDELIDKYLDGDLTPDEQGELDTLAASNAMAREQFEKARDFKQSLSAEAGKIAADPAAVPSSSSPAVSAANEVPDDIPYKKTPLWLKAVLLFTVFVIVFVLVLFPLFIELESPLLTVKEGQASSAGVKTKRIDDKGGLLEVEAGETAVIEVRGGTLLTVTGPAKLEASEHERRARIVLHSGSYKVLRAKGDTRECILVIAGLPLEPQLGCEFKVEISGASASLTFTSGSALVVSLDQSGLPTPPAGQSLPGELSAGTTVSIVGGAVTWSTPAR